jgi:hypothetical protein
MLITVSYVANNLPKESSGFFMWMISLLFVLGKADKIVSTVSKSMFSFHGVNSLSAYKMAVLIKIRIKIFKSIRNQKPPKKAG